MAQFKSFAPNVEVNGMAILLVIESVGAFKQSALRILAEHGISDIKSEEWYPQQAYLDAYKTIAEKIGPKTLFLIGGKVPEKVLWPPDVTTVEDGLKSIDVAYHMNQRGGEVGYYKVEIINERAAKMICKNPYPCDFDQGLIKSVVEKFKPKGSPSAKLQHLDLEHCRKKGFDECTYIVSW
jgi:hypothetical protein